MELNTEKPEGNKVELEVEKLVDEAATIQPKQPKTEDIGENIEVNVLGIRGGSPYIKPMREKREGETEFGGRLAKPLGDASSVLQSGIVVNMDRRKKVIGPDTENGEQSLVAPSEPEIKQDRRENRTPFQGGTHE